MPVGDAAAMLPPLNLNEADPAVAPVTVPPQLLLRLGVAATVMPAGSVSLNDMPLMAALWLFSIISLSFEVCPSKMVDAVANAVPAASENVLVMVGRLVTISVSAVSIPIP